MEKVHYKSLSKRILIEEMPGLRNVKGKHHISNMLFDYNGKNCRIRGEVLVFKNNTVFLYIKNRKYQFQKYNIPGGGYDDKDTDTSDAAIRECKEEARINIKNIQYVSSYIFWLDSIQDWVKEEIPNKNDQWRYYYTDLYVADYDSDYKGHINNIDQEKDMITFGKFYEINKELLDFVNTYHRKGIEFYLKNK